MTLEWTAALAVLACQWVEESRAEDPRDILSLGRVLERGRRGRLLAERELGRDRVDVAELGQRRQLVEALDAEVVEELLQGDADDHGRGERDGARRFAAAARVRVAVRRHNDRLCGRQNV